VIVDAVTLLKFALPPPSPFAKAYIEVLPAFVIFGFI
jgi:hypothetical protein